MIKKYINKLADENNQTLDKLERQMKDLLSELSSAEEWSETLQRENNAQTNIFSPRNMDTEIGKKIEKAIGSVSQIKQQIEYVRDLMETHLQKKAEYERMFAELDKSVVMDNQHINDNNIDLKTENFLDYNEEESETAVQNKVDEKDETPDIMFDSAKDETSTVELKKFLSGLYSKTELCIAFLNGNKNRCKKELNAMKQEIKEYVEKIEDKE